MNTIDRVLIQINLKIKEIQHLLPKKDKRILVSLNKQLNNGIFLTENQGNLLVKILKENISVFKDISNDIEETINLNLWSKKFRMVERIRKIYIDKDYPSNLSIEFNFNTKLKEKLSKISSQVQGITVTQGSKFMVSLNEHNIKIVLDAFINDRFDIDEKIMIFYQEIKKIEKDSNDFFNIFSTTDQNLLQAVEANVGQIDKTNLLKLIDSKIRYQYVINEKIEENSLKFKIAQRSNRSVYINNEKFSFVELIHVLKDLGRLPILFIFDGKSSLKDKKYLKIVESAVTSLNLNDSVGIYFRYDKLEDQENFNKEISCLGYNKILDSTLTFAGICTSKLPKFMVKSNWKPNAVISFTNSFRSSKSFVYCNDIDLVIYYTNTKLLDEKIYEIL